MPRTLVMKFGGAAARCPSHFGEISTLVMAKKAHFDNIAIVISAMSNTTDQLLDLARMVHPHPPRRECDMLITTGERVSSSLLAMALQRRNQRARSLTGSQAGILTTEDHAEARIVDVQPWRIQRAFSVGEIVVIAGFQGVSFDQKEITTLGRGGSDTSAVALAAALGAEWVEFYKDVGGIYTKDPKIYPDAQLLRELTYGEAEKIAVNGAQILHRRALILAKLNHLPLRIFSLPDKIAEGVPSLGTSISPASAKKTDVARYETATP